MKIREVFLIAISAAAMFVGSWTASANLIGVYNTGVDGAGAPLPNGSDDPHYSLISVPSGTTVDRVLITGIPGSWISYNNSLSTWIGPEGGNTGGQVGLYTYRTTFDLTGLNPSTAAITGGWSTDNDGRQILLNGVNTGNPGTSYTQFGIGYAPFTISSGFLPGVNTLDFVVNNGGGPTGLRVEMTGSAAAVPEPSTYLAGALLLLPFGVSTLRKLFKNSAT